ncbi:Lipoyltransferase 1, mitochondrial [Hypsibius exemplaris]|uniref:Lipoyltransferase 1, mitochondrial n=1 Tax=Hypsibius exemplaris TaxID=2072580 RepID=A0A1W0XCS2_HYPEX|nr:Lipoyltransferase 1, mitochondrial [Hypsibius exemplaris]
MTKKWQVLISKSHDIYTNLAWEDWLYRKMDFSHLNLLLLWRNAPCVVVGRYQNPWKEVNVSMLEDAGVQLARRNSGGGTVYHDMGNLNFTFMTERKLYNRRTNLEFIVKVLREKYAIPAEVSQRDDIVVKGTLKISGTAAKLGRTAAYHHCTLLCNVRKDQLRAVLTPRNKGIHTNASISVPSPTVNLSEINSVITSADMIPVFAQQFSDLNLSEKIAVIEIDPSDGDYPGMEFAATDLASTSFIYGNTPKFNIIRDFVLPSSQDTPAPTNVILDILIEKGKICSFTISGTATEAVKGIATSALSAVVGCDFDSQEMWAALSAGFASSSATTSGTDRNSGDEHHREFVYRCLIQTLNLQE